MNIECMELEYFEFEHSQSEGNSTQSNIEQHPQKRSMYGLWKYLLIVTNSVQVKPYSVNELSHSDITNFDQ
jgi:hypothetical protein